MLVANRWRVFRRSFSLEQEKVKVIVLAIITLHNWLLHFIMDSSYGKVYIPSEFVDNEDTAAGKITRGTWRKDPLTESWYSISVT